MLNQIMAVLVLLGVASYIHYLGKRIRVPYTILLFVVGVIVGVLSLYVPFFGFLQALSLTPELLFYVFLPVLLFEAGYNIKYSQLTKDYILIR